MSEVSIGVSGGSSAAVSGFQLNAKTVLNICISSRTANALVTVIGDDT